MREIHAVFTFPDWLPLPHKKRKRWAIAQFDDLIRRMIAERRTSSKDHGDLLSQLLLAVDDEGDGQRMTIQQARDEAMTLFTAAFHANSMALTWTWYLLARHPEVERRLQEEVDRVLAGRDPAFEDIERLAYTQMVIQESLRLYPPAWALFCREAVKDVDLGGYRIRRGSWVFLYPYVTHRDPRFFPNPLRFNPDRFAADSADPIPKYAYFPFGAGPRACVGNTFAMMEMMLIVAMVVQRFRLCLPVGAAPKEAEAMLAIRPKGGLQMQLAHRTADQLSTV